VNYQTIKVNKTSSILSISLDRPSIGNAFNTVMRDELFSVLKFIEVDIDVKVVLITGSGQNFCTGADLTEFGTSPSLITARDIRRQRDLWTLMLSCPVPIVSAIQGQCIGSGLEIALYSDIRIATTDSQFSMPETTLGLIPAAGGTQTLPRTVKMSKAFNLLLAGESINGIDAKKAGLISRLTTLDKLNNDVSNIIQMIINNPRPYLTLLKSQISSAWTSQRIPS